jgi:hypothetical protein
MKRKKGTWCRQNIAAGRKDMPNLTLRFEPVLSASVAAINIKAWSVSKRNADKSEVLIMYQSVPGLSAYTT